MGREERTLGKKGNGKGGETITALRFPSVLHCFHVSVSMWRASGVQLAASKQAAHSTDAQAQVQQHRAIKSAQCLAWPILWAV